MECQFCGSLACEWYRHPSGRRTQLGCTDCGYELSEFPSWLSEQRQHIAVASRELGELLIDAEYVLEGTLNRIAAIA